MPNIKTIKYLTQDELKRLFNVIDSKRDKAIFLLAYRHGLRISEIGMLRNNDVNFSTGRIMIERLKNSQGGEHPLQVDELKALRAWFKERKDQTPFLFPSARGYPIAKRTLDYLMKRYAKKANLPPDKWHFHVLKHSIATHLLDAGGGIRFVQDWIGHKNIENTVIYAHLSHHALDEQARRFLSSSMIVSG